MYDVTRSQEVVEGSPVRRTGEHIRAGIASRLQLESFRIVERVDAAQRYHLVLDRSFPLGVRLYDFPSAVGAVPMTWHERLEVFCPLTGSGGFRVGEHLEPFEGGDILLIDNLRLHGVERFEGPQRHALVIVFYPELVAAPGALPCDFWLLRPFRHLQEGCLRLQSGAAKSEEAWQCLSRLVAAHTDVSSGPAAQARQKTLLADLLLILGDALGDRIVEDTDYENRRMRLRRLSPLFQHVAAHLDEHLSVPDAARRIRMSTSYFMRFFRLSTGLTFSAYVEHMRVSRAFELLIDTDLSLEEIAEKTGFCDQCHLSRHIRRRFGDSPGRIRAARRAGFNAREASARG